MKRAPSAKFSLIPFVSIHGQIHGSSNPQVLIVDPDNCGIARFNSRAYRVSENSRIKRKRILLFNILTSTQNVNYNDVK